MFGQFLRQCPEQAQLLPRGLILLYHRVSRGDDPFALKVRPEIFESQLQVVGDHWPVLPIAEGWRRVQESIPGCWVAISFDDGYRDFMQAAWPSLSQRGFAATVFACTHRPEQEFWWDRLTDPARQPELRTSLDPQLDAPNRGDALRLTPHELAWLARQPGCQVGNHSHRHLSLPGLCESERDHELQQARQLLCLWTGQSVEGLAYPYGDLDEATRATAARHAEWACTVTPDLVWKHSDPYGLPRAWVPNLEGKDFYRWLRRLGLS